MMIPTSQIAEVAHEVNRAFCVTIGDMSQPAWADAPEWQKVSAILGVEAIINKPEMTPKDSHLSWLAHKLKEGWRMGKSKDPYKKEHPCMVPYEMLPDDQKHKDLLYTRVVNTMLAMQ